MIEMDQEEIWKKFSQNNKEEKQPNKNGLKVILAI